MTPEKSSFQPKSASLTLFTNFKLLYMLSSFLVIIIRWNLKIFNVCVGQKLIDEWISDNKSGI